MEPEVVLEAEPVQVEDAADEEPEAETPVTEELSFY